MESIQIENIEDWLRWKRRIISAGFAIWQTQYGWNLPDGLIVGFISAEEGQKFEIVTHSKEVAEDIGQSKL